MSTGYFFVTDAVMRDGKPPDGEFSGLKDFLRSDPRRD